MDIMVEVKTNQSTSSASKYEISSGDNSVSEKGNVFPRDFSLRKILLPIFFTKIHS